MTASAATLKDAVNAHTTNSLTPAEMDFLLSYLEQIDGLESGPLDSDDDNLADELERVLGTDPNNADTDGDTISDYDELNLDEVPGSYTFGQDLDPLLEDTDADGYRDDVDTYPLQFNYADGDLAPRFSPDGQINVADLLVCQRIVMGLITPTEPEIARGDIFPQGAPDGVINLSDYINLLNRVLGSGAGTD